MSKSSAAVIAVVVLVLTVATIYLAAHRHPSAPGEQAGPRLPKNEGKLPQAVQVSGGQIEQKDKSGQVLWRVSAAGELEFDKDRQVAVGKNVKFELTQAGKSPITMDAPAFEANYNKQKLIFSQGVTGQMPDKASRFKVNQMEFDFATRKLLGTGGVQFSQGQYTATAKEIVVDTAQRKVRLRGGVQFMKNG